MPKGKLTIKQTEQAKFELAGEFSSVKFGNALLIGDELHTEISYLDINNVVKMARLVDKVSDKQVADFKATKDKKAAEKAAKDKAAATAAGKTK